MYKIIFEMTRDTIDFFKCIFRCKFWIHNHKYFILWCIETVAHKSYLRIIKKLQITSYEIKQKYELVTEGLKNRNMCLKMLKIIFLLSKFNNNGDIFDAQEHNIIIYFLNFLKVSWNNQRANISFSARTFKSDLPVYLFCFG